MSGEITFNAGNRKLTMSGPVQEYVDAHRGWNADVAPCSFAMKDLPTGSVFLDVGANIGFYALGMAVQRPDIRIIAIEPIPHNVQALRHNILVNNINNIDVVHAGVAEKPGVLSMVADGQRSRVSDSGDTKIECITLNDFAHENVSGIKIDVEGYEPNVMAGASDIFSKMPLVHMEINIWWLMMRHYDIKMMLDTIWANSDVIGICHEDRIDNHVTDAPTFMLQNIVQHKGVSDLIFRPRGPFGKLEDIVRHP